MSALVPQSADFADAAAETEDVEQCPHWTQPLTTRPASVVGPSGVCSSWLGLPIGCPVSDRLDPSLSPRCSGAGRHHGALACYMQARRASVLSPCQPALAGTSTTTS